MVIMAWCFFPIMPPPHPHVKPTLWERNNCQVQLCLWWSPVQRLVHTSFRRHHWKRLASFLRVLINTGCHVWGRYCFIPGCCGGAVGTRPSGVTLLYVKDQKVVVRFYPQINVVACTVNGRFGCTLSWQVE